MYTITWKNRFDNTFTRDIDNMDDVHAFIGTLLINGYAFSVEQLGAR